MSSWKIVWQRLDTPGRETAELIGTAGGWLLRGCADFTTDGVQCSVEYEVRCDADWLTESATIGGSIGADTIDLELLRNAAGEWSVNGSKVWEVTGCDDVDFEFSPSTNTLPIRRASLSVGESIVVRAAWVRFPVVALQPFEQKYTRTGELTYRFESDDGEFTRELTVNDAGLVTDYPGLWIVKDSSCGEGNPDC